MKEIIAIGLNHITAPIEVREAVAFSDTQKREVISNLLDVEHRDGAVILNTCNRCEVYLCTEEPDGEKERLKNFLEGFSDLSDLEDHLYVHEGKDSVFHLFRVASGLDSMVKGEPQILGQVKEAYEFSCEEDCCDTLLHAVFKRAIRAGKRARDETSISEEAVSIGSAACELADEMLEDINSGDVLIVGAGDMGRMVLKNLVERGVTDPDITNRTFERSSSLAEEFKGRAVPLEELQSTIGEYDLVITSTGSSEPVITKDIHGEGLKSRDDDILFIDLAVPRDIEPGLEEIDGVHIYDLDGLDSIVEQNLAGGRSELDRIEEMIEEEYENLNDWLGHREAAPVIEKLNEKAEDLREKELEKAMNKLSTAEDRDEKEEVLEDFSRALIKKMLHDPIVNLKQMDDEDRLELVSDIFDLG